MTDFLQTVMDMRGGSIAAECSKRFDEVVAAVIEHGRGGDFTLKLHVTPSKLSMTRVVEVAIDADIKVKKPEEETGTALFFVSKEGALSREDPRQTEMSLFIAGERERTTD